MTMRLPELLSGFGAINVPDLEVSELVQDSRAVTPGVAFVALAGQRADVLRHAQQAQARGAVAVLSEAALLSFDGTNGNAGLNAATDLVIPQIVVPELAQNLPRLAQRFFADPGAKLSVIGVTGTNGKTSTVQLLAQALSLLGVRTASQGTLGAGMHGALRPGSHTTPEVLTTYRFLAQSAAAGASHIAMEVSSHALVQQRVQGVPFQVAIFTNLTRDHLDYHGTLEAYGAAKAKLFAWPGLSYAVINCDDPFGVSLLAATSAKHKLSFGMHPAAQVRASQVQLHAQGSAFRLDSPWGHTEIRCGLLGRFNVSNVLAVLATLGALGFSLSEMAAALKQVTPVPGRMTALGGGSKPLVVVDYAHTPDALEQALKSLREHTRGRLICVFGCGGDRDVGKRAQMGQVAATYADISIVTDDNPRSEDPARIVADIAEGFGRTPFTVEHERAAAIRLGLSRSGVGDVLLIAGKGHERTQDVAGQLRDFDDSLVVAAQLQSWAV